MNGSWRTEDQRRRRDYLRVASYADPERIQLALGCSYAEAWRLWIVQCEGTPALLHRWTEGAITWRRLVEIVVEHPGDARSQCVLAARPMAGRPRQVR